MSLTCLGDQAVLAEWIEIDPQRQRELLFPGRISAKSGDDPYRRVEGWSTYAYRALVQYAAPDTVRWPIFVSTARAAYDLLEKASRNHKRDVFEAVYEAVNTLHRFLPEHFPLYTYADAGPPALRFRESRERYLDLGESVYRHVMAPFGRAFAIETGQQQNGRLALNSAGRITLDALDTMQKHRPDLLQCLTRGFHRNLLTAVRHRNVRELSPTSGTFWVDAADKRRQWSEDYSDGQIGAFVLNLTATVCALVQATLLFYGNNWRRAVQKHWVPTQGRFDINEREFDRLAQFGFLHFGIHCLEIDADGDNRRVALWIRATKGGDNYERVAYDEVGVQERIPYFRIYVNATVPTLLGIVLQSGSAYWGSLGHITFKVFSDGLVGEPPRKLGTAHTEGRLIRSLAAAQLPGGGQYDALFTTEGLAGLSFPLLWDEARLQQKPQADS